VSCCKTCCPFYKLRVSPVWLKGGIKWQYPLCTARKHPHAQDQACPVLKAERPKELPPMSIILCPAIAWVGTFWLVSELTVGHSQSPRLSLRAALSLRQRKIFFFSPCIISHWDQTLEYVGSLIGLCCYAPNPSFEHLRSTAWLVGL
jgi:hypothetical protein